MSLGDIIRAELNINASYIIDDDYIESIDTYIKEHYSVNNILFEFDIDLQYSTDDLGFIYCNYIPLQKKILKYCYYNNMHSYDYIVSTLDEESGTYNFTFKIDVSKPFDFTGYIKI